MKKNYLSFFVKPILVLFLINGLLLGLSYAGGIRIGRTTMKVSKGTGLVFGGSLSVSAGASVTNDGSVYFKNTVRESLDINSLLGGSGLYTILGTDDFVLTGSSPAISSLTQSGGHTLWVDNDLSVLDKLVLGSGLIHVKEGSQLKIQSDNPKSVEFYDGYDNKSFVLGKLVRNTSAGGDYSFPVGSGVGFRPFVAAKVSASGFVGVAYDEYIDEKWSALGNKQVSLLNDGGWRVSLVGGGISFIPKLSMFTTEGIMDSKRLIFYTPSLDVSTVFSLDYNSKIDGEVLTTSKNYSPGIFAFAETESTPSSGSDIEVPQLVNFFVKGGEGRAQFEVPGINFYRSASLFVYNRFGNLVYKSNSYANDFNCNDYSTGTYFYELTLETQEGKSMLIRNIIEITDHK
jgi:hypothetical protein